MVDFKDLDVQSLNCKYCGNKEDFIITYRGTVVVHAYKDDTPDYEEPNEAILEIVCTECDRPLDPVYFIGKGE